MPGTAEIDAIILCGGLGTRLGSALEGLPKPMAPVGGKPFLQLLIENAAEHGFRRFILCVGHRAETIRSHFHSGGGLEFLFSEEPSPLGTAGALKLCAPLRRSQVSLVMNGDSYCPFDPAELLAFHARRGGRSLTDFGGGTSAPYGAVATLAVVASERRTDGGSIELGQDGRVLRFVEKQDAGPARWLNAGVYCLDGSVWDAIPAGRACSLERETFPALVERGLYAWPAPAPLHDIGTPERLEAFRRVFGRSPTDFGGGTSAPDGTVAR